MRIVNWNCNGAFRKKFSLLDQFNADIVVIQECENPEVANDKLYKEWATNFMDQEQNLGRNCQKKVRNLSI